MHDYDFLILGSGIAGLYAALLALTIFQPLFGMSPFFGSLFTLPVARGTDGRVSPHLACRSLS